MARPILRSQPRPKSSLLPLIVPVLVIGGLAVLHVLPFARLSELEYEARRLERLSLEQSIIRRELLAERTRLTSHQALWSFANQKGLIPAGEPVLLQLGPLPERQVYWKLPGEPRMAGDGDGAMVGWQLPPPGGPPM